MAGKPPNFAYQPGSMGRGSYSGFLFSGGFTPSMGHETRFVRILFLPRPSVHVCGLFGAGLAILWYRPLYTAPFRLNIVQTPRLPVRCACVCVCANNWQHLRWPHTHTRPPATPRWIPLKIAQRNEICKLAKGVDNYLHNKANSSSPASPTQKVYIYLHMYIK